MSYIGNQPTSVAFVTDQFSGNGSTTAFTMSAAPANTASVLVAVSGVLQDPSTYAVSGTTLTFSAAPPTGTGNISVRFLGIPASNIATTAYRTITEFTATAGQTTFNTASYTVGFINVYRNGVLLGTADYTATNGTTVVLAIGATAGDLITTESFYVSSMIDGIPAVGSSVIGAYIADGAVSTAKIANSAVTIPKISATGTPSSTTFLRGDGAWTTAAAPVAAGTIIQVVYTQKTSTFSGTSVLDNGGYFIDVTGLSASITPISSSSKIIIIANMYVGTTTTGGAYQTAYRLKRTIGGTTTFPILGDAEGGRPRATGRINAYPAAGTYWMTMLSGTHQDSPATTSAITYQIQLGGYSAGPVVYLNRSETFQNVTDNYDSVPVSTITLMEIAG
jgi:hypothetical protein